MLLLLGPVGWLGLLLLLGFGAGREDFAVRVPYTERAAAEERSWRRLRSASTVACLAAVGLAVLHPVYSPLSWVALAVASLAALLVACTVLYFRAVDVSLDGSRRWVALANLHPSLARAVVEATDANGRLVGDDQTPLI